MDGAGDQAETGCVRARPSCKESAHHRNSRFAHSICDILAIKYQTTLSRETKFSGARNGLAGANPAVNTPRPSRGIQG